MKILDALIAPIYAVFFDPTAPKRSDSYRPETEHVGFWFLIAIVFSLVGLVLPLLRLIFDWGGTPQDVAFSLSAMAWSACLICRLALVERLLADHINSSKLSLNQK